ncbi:hypothetical protein OG777_10090 [Micromonospora peucetia]|uniref:hypothetical protein n=1 Tax=Micromonospora peucetia TaxID=47871 RepID=UPI002257D6F2|nr:hypothetical protein [Micromonospora peucetia]MCX4387281.1 hypothetical protein [Micromonospora peucetia]
MTVDRPSEERTIAPGKVIRVPEDSYQFGTGALAMYATEVLDRSQFQVRGGSSCVAEG